MAKEGKPPVRTGPWELVFNVIAYDEHWHEIPGKERSHITWDSLHAYLRCWSFALENMHEYGVDLDGNSYEKVVQVAIEPIWQRKAV